MTIEEANQVRINKIKAEMGVNGDTQISLASKLNISRDSLRMKLRGESPFTIFEIESLALIYNKERTYFF